MFTRSVDSIVSNIQRQIEQLRAVVTARDSEANEARMKLDYARAESDRAQRLATKFSELIS